VEISYVLRYSKAYHEIHQFVITVKTFLCDCEQRVDVSWMHIKANNNTIMVIWQY